MTVQVKICGITRVEDAMAAVEAGADAVGFVFYEHSVRHISMDPAGEIVRQLPPFIARVGVFVNAAEEAVCKTIAVCGINVLQFHGNESPEYCRSFSLPVIKGFKIKDAESLNLLTDFRAAAWLLDSCVDGQSGGTGEKFNWDLAVQAKALGGRIILAGGLTPENVAASVRQVQPYAVDVSSGVESAPGKKDGEKICRFIKAAKGAL